MNEEICKEVYEDALKHNLPASVSVFLRVHVPYLFRKIKRQKLEIESLKKLWEKQ